MYYVAHMDSCFRSRGLVFLFFSLFFLRANKQWSEREMCLRATAACRARTLVAELQLLQGAERGVREGGQR